MYSYICYTFISSPNQKSFFRESEHLLDNVFSEFRRDRLENERGIVFETLFRQYFNSFTFTYPVVFADGRGAAADRQTTPPLRTILGFSWSIRSYSYSSSSGCRPPISFSGLHACVYHLAFLEGCSLLVLTIVERDRTIFRFLTIVRRFFNISVTVTCLIKAGVSNQWRSIIEIDNTMSTNAKSVTDWLKRSTLRGCY